MKLSNFKSKNHNTNNEEAIRFLKDLFMETTDKGLIIPCRSQKDCELLAAIHTNHWIGGCDLTFDRYVESVFGKKVSSRLASGPRGRLARKTNDGWEFVVKLI